MAGAGCFGGEALPPPPLDETLSMHLISVDRAFPCQWWIQRGCTGTHLWAAPSIKKYTDVRLNRIPLSGYRTLSSLWLTLECCRRNLFENSSIGLVVYLEMGVILPKVSVVLKIRMQKHATVYQNPPSRSHGSPRLVRGLWMMSLLD